MPARDAGPGRSRPRAVPNPLPPPNWHHVPADEVLQVLQVDLATGLDEPEVQRRRQEFGPNQVTARRGIERAASATRRTIARTISCSISASTITSIRRSTSRR